MFGGTISEKPKLAEAFRLAEKALADATHAHRLAMLRLEAATPAARRQASYELSVAMQNLIRLREEYARLLAQLAHSRGRRKSSRHSAHQFQSREVSQTSQE